MDGPLADFQATSMEYQLKSIDKFLFFSKINAKSALGRQLPFVGFSYFFYWHDFVVAVHILFFADLCLLLCFFNLLKVKQSWNVFLISTFLPKKWTNKLNFTNMIPQVDLSSFVSWKKLKTSKKHFEINWPLSVIEESLPGIARLEIACFI